MDDCKCYLCGSSQYRLIRQWVRQCRSCSLAVSYPLPTDGELSSRYSGDYYRGWEGTGARRKMWLYRLRQVQKFILKGKLLDVGCGSGEFLQLMEQAGFDGVGTEFSKHAIGKNSRFLVYPEIKSVPGTFDLVTLWHVLEHVRDPRAALKSIQSKLKNSGLLYVAVPNLNSKIFNFFYILAKQKKEPLYTPEAKEPHLFHFTLKTLTLLLEQAGLVVVSSGLDSPPANIKYYLADWPGRWVYRVTKLNGTSTLMIVAKKRES